MGRSRTWAGRVSRLAWSGLAAGAAALVVAACGSQLASPAGATQAARPGQGSAAPPEAGTGRGLCSHVPAVTRLAVRRNAALPGNHLHFTAPARVTVSSPAQARAVARALCGLPLMPSAPMPCPMDRGVSYRLGFAAGPASLPEVTVAAGGCNPVTGAGPVRRAGAAGFWTVLGQAMGIRHAAGAALRGTSLAG